jgi:hypothetical protein
MKATNLFFLLTMCLVIFCSYTVKHNDEFCKTNTYTTSSLDCGENESMSVDYVFINYDPQGYEEWTLRSGLMDGKYYDTIIVFSDGTKGRLFRGGASGNYFVEDSGGNNFYYANLKSAIRALYLYKKYGCLSSKYRL